jgi:hypothetical protein
VDLDEFKRLVQEGKMVTSIPEGVPVYLGAGIHLIATKVNSSVEPQDLIREVEDELRGLRGEPTSDAVCAEAYAAYLQDPSDAGLERLRAAYEVVPGHLREFLMMPDGSERDLDDAIRALLGYPDD